MSACDVFYLGQVVFEDGPLGDVTVLQIADGKVTVGNLLIGGAPVAVTFDCAQFETGFAALLTLLGL